MVELTGLEPVTPCLQSRCSCHLSYSPQIGGLRVPVGLRTAGRSAVAPLPPEAAPQRVHERGDDRVQNHRERYVSDRGVLNQFSWRIDADTLAAHRSDCAASAAGSSPAAGSQLRPHVCPNRLQVLVHSVAMIDSTASLENQSRDSQNERQDCSEQAAAPAAWPSKLAWLLDVVQPRHPPSVSGSRTVPSMTLMMPVN